MIRRRRICLVPCLALACIFFYTRASANNLLWSSNDRSRLLAEDALLAACDSVHEATLSLLEAHEHEARTAFERTATHQLGTKFERLQASFENFHRKPPFRNNLALEGLSGLRSVKGRYIDMCQSLAGNRITMIGGEHIYRLHVHLLQHRERAEKKPFPCPYHEFCTHHHICLPCQHLQDDAPPPRYVKPPTTQELIETESAIVKYIVSDTLLPALNESSWQYTSPFLDPMTGVRLRETYWLAAARKANVIILGRGPLSAPGQTYTGNWSFLSHVPDYVDKSRVSIASGFKHHDDESTYLTDARSLEILNAAVHLTVSRFLPDLFQLLQSIQREVRPSRRKRLIWPGNWYRLPGRGAARTAVLRPHVRTRVQDLLWRTLFQTRRPCSSAEHVLTLQLSALIDADFTNTTIREDPWTMLFNTQGECMGPSSVISR